MEVLQDRSKGRFKLYVSSTWAAIAESTADVFQMVLNNPPAGWTGGSGFVTREMVEKHMPSGGVGSAEHGKGGKVLLCGPPPMLNAMKWVDGIRNMVYEADGAGRIWPVSGTPHHERSRSSRIRCSCSRLLEEMWEGN